MLQDVQWKTDCEFTGPKWHVIHSAGPDRCSGVLIMVDKRLCQPQNIRFQAVQPGCILHVRLHLAGHSLDAMCVYQHPWSNGCDTISVQTKRGIIWDSPSYYIRTLGDFNTSLTSSHATVGQGALPAKHQQQDASILEAILEAQQLCVLNSWGRRDKAHTYVAPNCKTQTDFLITRQCQADPIARQSAPFDCDLFHWRGGGLHRPISACIPYRVYQTVKPQHAAPGINVQQLVQDLHADSRSLQRMQQAVCAQLALSKALTPAKLNAILMQEGACHYPASPKRGMPRPWQCQTLQLRIRDMWQCRTLALRVAGRTLGNYLQRVLTSWRLIARFLSMQRQIRTFGKQKRKQEIQDLIQQAEDAYENGNMKVIYSVVGTLAPKQPRKRAQLRGEGHRVLSPLEELEAFQTYCHDLFCTHQPPVDMQHLQYPICPGYHELLESIQQIKMGKAVPPGCAPIELIGNAESVAKALHCICRDLWVHDPAYPFDWASAWLTWTPKRGRTLLGPQDLRPIALQDGCGKAVLKTALAQWPQYAYCPGRGLETALCRAGNFCHDVRQNLQCVAVNLHVRRHQGIMPTQCTGGAMLAVDLSRAFDMVSHHDLFHSMVAAGIPQPITQVILALHNNISYHLRVSQHTASVAVRRGVRQGCIIAPHLWNLTTSAILQTLSQVLPTVDHASHDVVC